MPQNIYITGAEHGSGKSVIVLAMMEYFSGNIGKTGFFRPIIHDHEPCDPLIELITQRYQIDSAHEDLYGCRSDTARQLLAEDRYDELLKRILEKYRRLQQQFDHVLCVGTDYSGAYAMLEFDFNADIANNLNCLIMPVVRGIGRSNSKIKDASTGFLKALKERHCDILATVVNGVARSQFDELKIQLEHNTLDAAPVYLVPEEPVLARAAIGDITRSLDVQIIYADNDSLNREVTHYTVAAMQIPDFLGHLETGSLVITPGDRSDIILACLMAYPSTTCPQISGLLLTGNIEPARQLVKLLSGLEKPPFAVLSTSGDTFNTAMQLNQLSSTLRAENEHKIAAALGLVDAHIPLPELVQALANERSTRVTPLMFEYELTQRARANLQHIVLPEGDEERILRAAEILTLRGAVKLTLLGNGDEIRQKIQELGLHLEEVDIIDPLHSELREQYADTYYELRQHKGISREMAFDTMADTSYFGTMMVHHAQANGMVSGAVHTTQHTIRPAFEIIKTRPGTAIVSSVFFMCMEDRVLVYGDCAVNPDPDAAQLADIAIRSADTAQLFGVEPRIAMLSYSTGASGKGEMVNKVREATQLAKVLRPDVLIEGPIQYDAAVDASVASTKLPESQVAGNASVFIFPDLNTGNNTYKAVQRSAGAIAIGPVLQGLNKPVNDLSRGCTVTDIANTVLITAIQAQADGTP